MSVIVRESILANIETVMNTISVANGYINNIASVQRWKQSGNNLRQAPCIIIGAGNEDKSREISLIPCVFNVNLEVWTRHDEVTVAGSTDTVLNSLLGDVEKALMVDHTRGGYAVDTVITGNVPFETVEGAPYVGIVILMEVHYRHKIGDLTVAM